MKQVGNRSLNTHDMIMGGSTLPRSFKSKNWNKLAWIDDVDSFLYYGTFGLLDPKMPAEARAYQKGFSLAGWRGFALGAGMSMTGGFILAGFVGWAFDPNDRRKGGIVEWRSYQKYVHPHVQNVNLAYRQGKRWIKSRGHPDYYIM